MGKRCCTKTLYMVIFQNIFANDVSDAYFGELAAHHPPPIYLQIMKWCAPFLNL